jgi:hypothetical protein
MHNVIHIYTHTTLYAIAAVRLILDTILDLILDTILDPPIVVSVPVKELDPRNRVRMGLNTMQ